MNGYLIGMAAIATISVLAVFSPRRPRLVGRLGSFLSSGIPDFPLYGALWVVAATWLAGVEGDLARPASWVGLVLAAMALAVFAVALRRGLAARSNLTNALHEAGLGAAADEVAARGTRSRILATLVAPFIVRTSGVVRQRNIRYGPHARRHRLDVIHPRRRQPAGPVLVHLHGGGYHTGRKNWESRRLLARMAAGGWLCVSADYRLRPEVGFDGHLADLGAVLAWVRARAADFGGDPDRVVLAGSSAGAHLGSIAAMTPAHPALGAGGAPAADLAAMICLYGYYGPYGDDRRDDQRSTNPTALADSSDGPPFLVIHGDRDALVPVATARSFAEARKRVRTSTTVYAELVGAPHSFDLFRSPRFESVVDTVQAFLGPNGLGIDPAPPSARSGIMRKHGGSSYLGESTQHRVDRLDGRRELPLIDRHEHLRALIR